MDMKEMNEDEFADAVDRDYEKFKDDQLNPEQEYLADGVYVQLNGSMLKLTTGDGIKVTNTIYVDEDVLSSLIAFINRKFPNIELKVVSK